MPLKMITGEETNPCLVVMKDGYKMKLEGRGLLKEDGTRGDYYFVIRIRDN